MDGRIAQAKLASGMTMLGILSTGVGVVMAVAGIVVSLASGSDSTPIDPWTKCGIASAALGTCLIVLPLLLPDGTPAGEDDAG